MTHHEWDLRQLTNEELELLLQEEQDSEFLLAAADEYAGRLAQQGVEMPAPEASWAEFAAAHLPQRICRRRMHPRDPSHPKHRFWRKVSAAATAAAVAAVLLTGVAHAAGFPVFDWFPEWHGDRFTIQWDAPETPPDPKKVLKKYHITQASTPNWVPEGYQLTKYTDEALGGATVFYRGTSPALRISVVPYYERMEVQHEEKGKPTIYRANGITYYIFTGFKSTEVIWMEDGCECSLFWGQSVSQTKKLLQMMQEG